MHDFFNDLLDNRILLSVIIAWFVAQLSKAMTFLIINREWRWERLIGAGGMPSSHAASVCALCLGVLLNYGANSFPFTISVVLTIIVLHDARGVRLETGKQAQILNEIMRNWQAERNPFSDTILKELVGHTTLQVMVGCGIGLLSGLLIH